MAKARLKGKKVSESAVTTVRLMMPTDGNIMGNVFGGSIMKYVDEVAAIVAFRHTKRNCVTASIDRMNFLAPVYVGNILILKAAINYVGRTSMEIGVRIEAQNPLTGEVVHTGSCYLTYVALDEKGKPTPVPKIIPETEEEKRRYREGLTRRKMREAEIIALKREET
jgi:acyl-CoA hydrolase